jgi:hypothetical protein
MLHMGKITHFLFILLFNSILCLSGNAQLIYRENKVKYTGIEEIKTYNLYNKKDNPACHLKINFFYPEIDTDKSLREKLQSIFVSSFFGEEYAGFSPKKAVKSYSKVYVKEYKKTFEKPLYKDDIKKTEENGENFIYAFEKTMRNTIFFNQGNIISLVVNVYEYTGGAHGASFTKGLILDVNTGKEVKYEDIFYEEMEEALSELLLFHLMLDPKYAGETLSEEGFDFEVIHPTGNFVADEKGITFIYNPYELGAYILGIIEIFVPYSDLFLYMNPDGTLYRWARNHIPVDDY